MFLLTFDPAYGKVRHNLIRERRKQGDCGNHRDDQARKEAGRVGNTIRHDLVFVQPRSERGIGRQIQDDRLIIVPVEDGVGDRIRQHNGYCVRKHNTEENGIRPRPVDLRRLRVRPAHRFKEPVIDDEVASEAAKRRYEYENRFIDNLQFARQFHARSKIAYDGYHQGRDRHGKNQVFALEIVLAHNVARNTRHNHAVKGRDARIPKGVDEHPEEGRSTRGEYYKRFRIIAEQKLLRKVEADILVRIL